MACMVEVRVECFSGRSCRASFHYPKSQAAAVDAQSEVHGRRRYAQERFIALLPAASEFDSEAQAAEAVDISVLRFDFDDNVRLHGETPSLPCRALWRGFMLSAERYAQMHSELAALHVHLVTSPTAYERVLYYPLAYDALAPLSPPATWVPVPSHPSGSIVPRSLFVAAAHEAASWPNCEFVMLKDYIKAAKEQGRFFKVAVEEAAEFACELVHARGSRFERGVVFKQWVQLAFYPGKQKTKATNEWRLWFSGRTMLSMHPNSFQSDTAPPPPAAAVDAAIDAAARLDSPLLAIDLAEREDGEWICLESNDGGASGPAPEQDLTAFWRTLREVV